MGNERYGVILDAGSSGTRVHIYTWLDNTEARMIASEEELDRLPQLTTEKSWTKKVKPGISTFAYTPDRVGPDYLDDLFKHALSVIPEDAVTETPFFVYATAGMRLLPDLRRKRLLFEICSYAQKKTDFLLPDCDQHVQVISGETEGVYGWLAVNYLLGSLDHAQEHEHGKGHHTYGFLDMGGASAQMAFLPNQTEADDHIDDLKLVRARKLNGQQLEFRMYVTSWLGFGVHEARKDYLDSLYEASGGPGVEEVPDPCLPPGLRLSRKGDILLEDSDVSQSKEAYVAGTGDFQECLSQTYPLLDKDVNCKVAPCLLQTLHAPDIDFDINHFIGVSEYWHTTHEIFEMAHKDRSYDFNTYQTRVEEFCSQSWDSILEDVKGKTWGKKVKAETAAEVCFKAAWLINFLHNGIGIPRIGLEDTDGDGHNGTQEVIKSAREKGFLDPFQAVDNIDGTEINWTLGKMLLYACSQVSSTDSDLPVGFGSNTGFVPDDFQYGGPHFAAVPDGPDHPLMEEEVATHSSLPDSSSSRRIPGFILFVLIVAIAAYLWCGRERRRVMIARLAQFIGRPGLTKKGRKLGIQLFSNPRHYERVLESGDGPTEFELRDADSEDDHSDSSEGSRLAQSSGLATPQLKVAFESPATSYVDNFSVPGPNGSPATVSNAMTRSGLVGRTDSRDRLTPIAIAGPGKKSRSSSPTRMPSPRLPPKERS
ncbi:MAG: hypothetical protein M1825_004392 [Sarcosagium campestre]|nr:MAG: hypothetical protein M1825_004392 [Sarcosagium campestre]